MSIPLRLTTRAEPALDRPIIAGPDDSRPIVACGNDLVRVLVPSEATSNAYAVWVHTAQPGSGPPLHVRMREDEIFHILEGRPCILCDGRSYEASPGDTAALPRGLAHSFRVISATPARKLMTVVLDGFEHFFEAAAEPHLAEDEARVRLIGEEFGVHLVDPPLEG